MKDEVREDGRETERGVSATETEATKQRGSEAAEKAQRWPSGAVRGVLGEAPG